ncbi:MAG TPA: hypothetical protein VGR35_12505 [Tepidisphaeraceae bacterium]|nr:hypothetical protein [Tepidisphaeraceae bacterium]
MRKVIASLALVAMAGLVTTVWAQAKAEEKTLEGELVDMWCFSKGGAKGDKHAACGEKCAETGIPAGVLVDEKATTIVTNPQPLAASMGRTVRVTGSVNAENNVILPSKVEVKKDDGTWEQVKLKDQHHK